MLINLRNALMAGKRLPYDAEVEWLGSTGTQFILTNLVLNSYDYSFEYGGKKCEWGWIHNNVVPGTWLAAQFTGGVAYQFYRTFNARYAKTDLSPSTRYDYKYGINGFWIAGSYMGGASVSIGSDPITTGLPLFVNYDFYNNSYQARGTPNLPCTFEYFRAYKQDELVLDYIPVRVGTVGYLYDRVSGKLFGNAGTGDFVLGPDVVPVEYIESHRTEYIDTGFIPGLNFHIDVRGRKTGDYSANAAIFSNEGVNSYVDCYYNAGWGVRCYGNGMTRPIYDGWFDAGIDFDFTSSPTTTFHLNSEEATATTSKTEAQITGSTKSVRLFRGMYGKTNPVDIAFFNADKSGQPALRLIAVRVGTEGAMMDTLTRRIYRNAGTGAFTYGNDLKYPIPAE